MCVGKRMHNLLGVGQRAVLGNYSDELIPHCDEHMTVIRACSDCVLHQTKVSLSLAVKQTAIALAFYAIADVQIGRLHRC